MRILEKPFSSAISLMAYFLEKAYVSFLKTILPHSEYVLNSTNDFIDKIKDLTITEKSILASLDIVSLYPSINVQEIKSFIENSLDKDPILDVQIKNTIKSGINLITNNNVFIFNGRYYKQLEGAPVGSPISELFAEIKLRPLEMRILADLDLRVY